MKKYIQNMVVHRKVPGDLETTVYYLRDCH